MNGRLLSIWISAGALVLGAESVTPLDVKPGLWEVTTTSETSGTPPIPPEALAKLTPEQRARLDAAMKAQQAKGPQKETTKSCLTKESLAKFTNFGMDDKSCKTNVIRSTGSVQDVRFECAQNGLKRGGELHVEAMNQENAKGNLQMNVAGGGNKMDAKMSFTARWVGADCGDVK